MTRLPQKLRRFFLRSLTDRFLRSEEGSGTVLSLFGVLVLLMLAGVAIDSANAWKNRELMLATSDAVAHAGASALARGAPEHEALLEAYAILEANMPQTRFGHLESETTPAVVLSTYDSEANRFYEIGVANAVVVTLQRTRANHNPVPTFLFKMIGVNSWNVVTQSVAVLVDTKRCSGTDGIYAKGQVSLTAENRIGDGFCIHSQDAVWLPQNNTFEAGSFVSMPDVADCRNKCVDTANPGVRAVETNMILDDLGDYITGMVSDFTSTGKLEGKKEAFFETRPLDTDLSALDEVGVMIDELETGDVVPLSHMQASRIREYPAGLVYQIDCPGTGGGPQTTLELQGFGGAIMRNAALITDCSIHFGDMADIRGSLLITTRQQAAAVLTADEGARMGDPGQTCEAGDRTMTMSQGKLKVPAKFVESNVTLVVDDDVTIAAAPLSGTTTSKGLSIHSSAEVQIAASHRLKSCGNKAGVLEPDLRVIRYMLPG